MYLFMKVAHLKESLKIHLNGIFLDIIFVSGLWPGGVPLQLRIVSPKILCTEFLVK